MQQEVFKWNKKFKNLMTDDRLLAEAIQNLNPLINEIELAKKSWQETEILEIRRNQFNAGKITEEEYRNQLQLPEQPNYFNFSFNEEFCKIANQIDGYTKYLQGTQTQFLTLQVLKNPFMQLPQPPDQKVTAEKAHQERSDTSKDLVKTAVHYYAFISSVSSFTPQSYGEKFTKLVKDYDEAIKKACNAHIKCTAEDMNP